MGRGAVNPAWGEYPRILGFLTHAKSQVIFALISLILILVFNVSVFIYRPYDGLVFDESGYAIIDSVEKDSPAEKAGVLPGDEFLLVDEKLVDRFLSRPIYRPGLKSGDSVTYEIRRDGNILSIVTTLGGFFDSGLFFGPILGMQCLSFAFWLVGFLLCLFSHPEDIRARIAGLLWLLMGIAVSSGGPAGASYFWGANLTMKITWALLGFLVVALHLFFPQTSFSATTNRRLVRLFAFISFLQIVITVIDDTVYKVQFNIYTGLNNLVYGFALLSVLVSLCLLMRSLFLAESSDSKRQTRIILWGMAFGLLPFLVLTLVPLLFGMSYVDGAYTSLFLILIPLSYAYVIHQRSLIKVDFIINRMVVTFVMGLLVLTVSFLTLMVFSSVMNLPSSVPITGSIMAMIFALPSSVLREQANRWVSRTLYGAYYDHASVTGSLSGLLAKTLDRKILVQLLTDNLSQQMGIRQTGLLLLDGENLTQQVVDEAFTISLKDDVCQLLIETQAPVRAQNLWLTLSEKTKEHWEGFSWVELFAPLIFENRLVGILILGRRTAGDIYSDQDVAIIDTVAHQGALAAANVQLLEIQRGLSQKLVRAGEEERKQVVRELHDGVMQNLVFIKEIVRPNPEAVGYLGEVITTLRRIIRTQRPMNLDLGLVPALEDLVSTMKVLSGIDGPQIKWHSTIDNIHLSDEDATAIYRIAQEAMSNAIRHSRSKHIIVSLARDDHVLSLTIVDDGIGMPENLTVDGQYGLISMHERANMIGATLRIESYQGKGTKVDMRYTIC